MNGAKFWQVTKSQRLVSKLRLRLQLCGMVRGVTRLFRLIGVFSSLSSLAAIPSKGSAIVQCNNPLEPFFFFSFFLSLVFCSLGNQSTHVATHTHTQVRISEIYGGRISSPEQFPVIVARSFTRLAISPSFVYLCTYKHSFCKMPSCLLACARADNVQLNN